MPPVTSDKSADSRSRIALIIDGLEGDGAERQFCELAKGIDGLRDYDVHVIALEENERGHAWMLEQSGIRVNVFARRSRFDLSPISRIVRYVREHQIHLIHGYMSMGSEFGLIAAKICGIPVIVSSVRNGMNGSRREAVRTFYQSRFADLSVANSHAGFASRFRRMRGSFRVVYNGFDARRFDISEADKLARRSALSIGDDVPVICMAARMEPQKDHRTLLNALRLVAEDIPGALLLLAGEGSLENELRIQCRDLGIDENVEFLGHQRDIEQILAMSDVSVLLTNTDLHLEGISNTIIESMAVGTAVIATAGGGTDEILADSDAGQPPYAHGIKVEPFSEEQVAAGLRYYFENTRARQAIAEAARSMVLERFGLERFISENVTLYQELLGH